jgi:hypothetical protein
MSKYKEKTEQIVTTGTTYLRTNKVTFYIPEEADIVAEYSEVQVQKKDGVVVSEDFTRTLNENLNADNINNEFTMYNRQGVALRTISYKDMFFAVESFWRHLAEIADGV